MRTAFIPAFILASLLLAFAPAADAHHSAAAEYEANIITLQGTIAKVDWMNPHVWIFLDVRNPDGTVTHWQCEGGSPNGLISNGWRKETLKPGDRVTVECSRAKDRPPKYSQNDMCKIRAVTLPGGERLLMGSRPDERP